MTNPNAPVVAGVDGSTESRTCAQYAADIASRRARPLLLVHGYSHPVGDDATGLSPHDLSPPPPRVAAGHLLDEIANQIADLHPDLEIGISQRTGGGATVLVDESRRAELVVVGSRGLGGFSELLLGSVSAQVAAHADCPVIVVRPPNPDATAPPDAPIVVGVDGSAGCAPAIELAFVEAASRNVPLVAMHVYWTDPIDNLRHLSQVWDPAAARLTAGQVLAEAVNPWAAKYPNVASQTRLEHTPNPQYTLVKASRGAALVVVGSRGRGGFGGLLLGSVSQALVHHARSPVAIAHPHRTPGGAAVSPA